MKRHELFRNNLWLAIRRAPSDQRAAGFLSRVIYLIAYCCYLVVMFLRLGIWGAVAWGATLALAGGVAVLIYRNNKRSGESLLNLSQRPVESMPDLLKHREYISNAAFRSAILVDRAGCEVLIASGKLKVECRGTSRQRTLALARDANLWDGFCLEERDLLLSEEGSWSWEDTWPRIVLAEDVNVYRWVMEIDPILTPLEFVKLNVNSAIAITTKPQRLIGSGCRPSWDLRLPLAFADQMLSRCIAEGLQRGVYTEADEFQRSLYRDFGEQFEGKPSEDLLIGSQTVGQADVRAIQMMEHISVRRKIVLEALIEYLNSAAETPSHLDDLRLPVKSTPIS